MWWSKREKRKRIQRFADESRTSCCPCAHCCCSTIFLRSCWTLPIKCRLSTRPSHSGNNLSFVWQDIFWWLIATHKILQYSCVQPHLWWIGPGQCVCASHRHECVVWLASEIGQLVWRRTECVLLPQLSLPVLHRNEVVIKTTVDILCSHFVRNVTFFWCKNKFPASSPLRMRNCVACLSDHKESVRIVHAAGVWQTILFSFSLCPCEFKLIRVSVCVVVVVRGSTFLTAL